MDISSWPMNKKMVLPDHFFGRREVLQLAADLSDANAVYAISPAGLPEKTAIWEVLAAARSTATATIHVGLALGDQLPASDAEYNALAPVFPNVISSDGVRGQFEVGSFGFMNIVRVRMPVAVAGRRFVAKFIRHQGNASEGTIAITYSSMPCEVPTCLLSA